MPRMFFNQTTFVGERLVIAGPVGHHFVRVLRALPGEKIVIAASNGPFLSTVEKVDSDLGVLHVTIDAIYPPHEPQCRLVLIQGLTKGDKMDSVIQKCTEVGVTEFVCYESKRSVATMRGKVDQKLKRWRKISSEAASQAQRDVIPTLYYANSLSSLVNICESLALELVLLLDEAEKMVGIRTILQPFAHSNFRSVGIIIGPEGGWDDDERTGLQTKIQAQSVTLGPRILRTETAGVVAATIVLYHLLELGV